jgi:deazaflavin-dependent oxidoreductase (nitroreductase family)
MSQYTALLRRLGNRRWFAGLGRLLTPLDRRIYQLTGGRWSVIGRHELPSLLITTTGRRSGQPRTQPLLYARDGDSYIVIGSNWGQEHHPAWSSNLLAQPAARITLGRREIDVRAALITGADRDRLWEQLKRIWPGYAGYAERARNREIRIFRLTPGPASR